MKVKLLTIVNSRFALSNLYNQRLRGREKYWILKAVQKVNKELELLEILRKPLSDAQGNVLPDKIAEFNLILEEEIDLTEIKKISLLYIIENTDLSASELDLLSWLFEEDVE